MSAVEHTERRRKLCQGNGRCSGSGRGGYHHIHDAARGIVGSLATTTNRVQLQINGIAVIPAFSGITSAGLYQMNVVPVPAGLGVGDVPLLATVGGFQTPSGVVLSLQ